MYKWKVLLALVIVGVAFFILHGYRDYETFVFLNFSSVPFWASSALFYEPANT
jgi:hypothetical protein